MKNPFEIYTSLNDSKHKRQLDWEESAVDTQSNISEVFDEDRPKTKLFWLAAVLILIFTIFSARLFYLQIVRGTEFRALSENNRIRKQTILAPRGLVKDKNGQILAQNTASFNLVVVPFDLPKASIEDALNKLSDVFILDKNELIQKLKTLDPKSIDPVVIKQDVTEEQSIWFQTRASEFVGFSIYNVPIRQYLEPEVFSHILGYTGLVGPKDLEGLESSKYDSVDFVGRTGIEAVYEKFLHGNNGQNLIEVDAAGKLLQVLGESPPEPGSSLVLNIDKELSQKLYNSLTSFGKARRKAAAIAINPKNGEVLALLSLPGFDSNLFAHGIKNKDYQALLADKTLPLFNRAISGTYPPGSTVKPMVAAAALQENVVNENTIIVDKGLLVIPNQFNPSMAYNFYGWKRDGLGAMNVRSAIAQSSDIYFYTVTGGHPSSQIKGLGAEKLAEYYRKFNLGKITGIDLQGEKPGLVADPNWKADYFKNDPVLSKWYLGDTYHVGIGQGDMLATPLQVAAWTAVIANNGVGYKPQVLDKVLNEKGETIFENKSEILVNKFLDSKNIKIVQEGMRENVVSGSGRQLNTLPISSAGKTGTSQFDGSDPNRTHAWFTAYAPFEDPQIVITVLVEAGGEGHAVAVPVVRDALSWWAENRYGK